MLIDFQGNACCMVIWPNNCSIEKQMRDCSIWNWLERMSEALYRKQHVPQFPELWQPPYNMRTTEELNICFNSIRMIRYDVRVWTAVSANKGYLMIITSLMSKNQFPSVLLCSDKHLVALFYRLFISNGEE